MSRWFRHYAGMMRDDKLVRAAIKAKQSVERVVWVWGVILESAAEKDDHGKYEVDTAEISYFLRAKEADICHIIAALEELGRLHENRVVKWGDRQFISDRSNERQRRYRDKRKTVGDVPDNVTDPSLSRHRDAPEAETETETETEAAQQTVSEFENEDRVEAELRSAAGEHAPDSADLTPIFGLIEAGYDLVRDIVPVVRERAAKATRPIASWRYFVAAIEEARASNVAIKPKANGTPAEPVEWLPADSPLWGAMNIRSQQEKKRPLIARGSSAANGVGAFVPAAWLEERPAA